MKSGFKSNNPHNKMVISTQNETLRETHYKSHHNIIRINNNIYQMRTMHNIAQQQKHQITFTYYTIDRSILFGYSVNKTTNHQLIININKYHHHNHPRGKVILNVIEPGHKSDY